jgi:hypothetical protein
MPLPRADADAGARRGKRGAALPLSSGSILGWGSLLGMIAPHLPGVHAPAIASALGPAAAGLYLRREWWPREGAVRGTPRPAGVRVPGHALPWRRDRYDPTTYGVARYRTVLGYRTAPEGRSFWRRLRDVVWETERPFQGRWRLNTLIWGAPRSGKSKAMLIPAIMAWYGTRIVISTRRDLIDACAAACAAQGHRVHILDVRGELGSLTEDLAKVAQLVYHSPILGCGDLESALESAEAIAADAAKGSKDAGHWRGGAIEILATLFHAAALGDRRMRDVMEWVDARDFGPSRSILTDHGAWGALQMQRSIQNAAGEEMKSLWSALGRALRPFRDPRVLAYADTAHEPGSSLDVDGFLEGETLFAIASSDAAYSVGPLVAGLVQRIYRRVLEITGQISGGALPVPVGFFPDEIAQTCPLDNFLAMLGDGGGRNWVTTVVVQDRVAFERRYGAGSMVTLLQCCGNRVLLPGGGDHATLSAFSEIGGDDWVVHEEIGRSWEPRKWCHFIAKLWPRWPLVKERQEVRPRGERHRRLTVGDLVEVPDGHAVVQSHNRRPEYVRIHDYDQHEPWRTWARTTPEQLQRLRRRRTRGQALALTEAWLRRRGHRDAAA